MTVEQSFSQKNYSIEANYQALEDLVSSNPELWSDKYLLGTGAQLLRVIAAGQSANGVRTLQALYETLIGHMQRKDSILGFGETMGYNAFRGSNDILTIIATAKAPLSIPARSVVGNVQGTDLINIEPIVVSEGQTFSFRAKVGNLKSESRSIVDAEYKYIRFLSKNISDDVLFYINSEPTPYTTAFKDIFSTTDFTTAYTMLTNAFGSVDVFIVDRGGWNPADVSNAYTINYIEYTQIAYTASDIVFDYGEIQNVSLEKGGESPQTVESLRATIPYFRDTQREVLANKDPIKVLRVLMPNVESVNGMNLNTVHSLLTYKYSNYHLVPDEQLKEYETQLAPAYYFGFCPSNIVQPIQAHVSLDIEIVLFSTLIEEVNVKSALENILKMYENLPSVNSIGMVSPIALNDIESELNKLTDSSGNPIVKTAYVDIHSTPISGNTLIELGKFYTEDDEVYQAQNFQYQSGTIPNSFTEKYTICGDIVLEQWRLIYGYKELVADSWYAPDDIVGVSDTQIFRVHPYYTLPTVQPSWNSELGALTYSNDMIWLTIPYVLDTPYTDGALAIKGMIVTPVGSKVSYQLIGFTKTLTGIKENPEVITSLITETSSKLNRVREINRTWQSYTVLSMESLNIHV